MATESSTRVARRPLAVFLAIVSLTLAAWSIVSFVRHEGDIIRREISDIAAERDRQAKWKRAERLQTQIERTGASFAITKGPYEQLDMTDCRDPESALRDVNELADLYSDRIGNSFSIVLGPAFSDAHIDGLVTIPTLKYLNVSAASFSDEGLGRLRKELPDRVTLDDRDSNAVTVDDRDSNAEFRSGIEFVWE